MLSINLLLLFSLGKKYPWQKPHKCPRCSSPRLWGHGFVRRYFFGFNKALWLKRYRCPDCSHVFTLRPSEFYPGFQYPKAIILACLIYFVFTGKRIQFVSRQIQNYWTKGALIQINRFRNCKKLSLENIIFLHKNNIIISTHCIKKSSKNSDIYSPYRFFSVTKDFAFT